MSGELACPRLWEVEAVYDGRLGAAARASQQRHEQHCPACASERRCVQRMRERLCAADAAARDDIALRRVRRRVLFQFNGQLVAVPRRCATRRRQLIAGGAAVAVALAVCVALLVSEGGGGGLRVVAGDGARYRAFLDGAVRIVDLYQGRLELDYRGAPGQLRVRVPDGEIEDLGTTFSVTVQAGRTTEIAVHQGAVEFRRADQSNMTVTAGEVFRAPQPPRPTRVLDAAASVQPNPAPLIPTHAPGAEDEVQTPPPSAANHPREQRKSTAASGHGRRPVAQRRRAYVAPAVDSTQAHDVAYLRILALLREGRRAQARVAAHQYLSRFPNGFRRREVLRIVQPTP